MNKGLFLDLDGTLLDSNYKISTKTRAAIKKAQNLGWKIYLATGKSFLVSARWANDLKLDTPVIASQGQVIIKYPFTIMKFMTQDFGYTKKILKSSIVKPILKNWTIETMDAFWILKKSNNQTLKLIDNYEKNVFEYSEEHEKDLLHSAIIGIYFDIPKTKDEELLKLMRKLNRAFPSKEFLYWYTDYDATTITIKPRQVNKWTAIEIIKKTDKLDFTVAIGNGYSDRPMIQNADIGIAMKNSEQKLKDSANWVSKYDNDEDGVAYEINKILSTVKD